MSLRKAAEMALEALEDIFGKEKKDVGAINALRQALAQPEQEKLYTKQDMIDVVEAVSTALQRKWVGLTYDDKVQIHTMWVLNGRFEECLDATEAKLKEKNT